MSLSEIYQALGKERFEELVRGVSIGALRTYKMYETIKVRARLPKLNRDRLRKAVPRLWERIETGDDDLGRDLSQAILISHLDFVVEALDFLEISHDGAGFFDKDEQATDHLSDGWQARVLEKFRDRFSESLILFYVNHLGWELGEPETAFVG